MAASKGDKHDKAGASAKGKSGKPAGGDQGGHGGKAQKADKPVRAPKREKPAKGDEPAAESTGEKRPATRSAAAPPRLLDRYTGGIRAELMQAHGIDNIMAAPRLLKIVVSMGVGAARENKAVIEMASGDLAIITGQKPAVRVSRKAISNFKIREGMPIGCMVTLRGHRMWEFLDRLISVVMPRVKDFRGLRRSGFDGRGSYSMGLPDQTVFPEIDLDRIKHMQGMNISIVTTAGKDAIALDLLERLGLPFRRADADKTDDEGGRR
jgi:large subunit ribosomal protein L5